MSCQLELFFFFYFIQSLVTVGKRVFLQVYLKLSDLVVILTGWARPLNIGCLSGSLLIRFYHRQVGNKLSYSHVRIIHALKVPPYALI
jgi:hypothetical protein